MSAEKPMHPSIRELLRFFDYDHLPPHLAEVSKQCHDLAHKMVDELPGHQQLTKGLDWLLLAKDCFTRAATIAGDHHGPKD